MIVKNEVANLSRCLESVAPYIDAWVIGDTGSTDGTQEFIRSFFAKRGIPGEVHEFPFIDFTQARNEALDCALRSTLEFDYVLLTDADMELVVNDPDFVERLDAGIYTVKQKSGLAYWNVRLIGRDVPARYRGVTHEYVDSKGATMEELHEIFYIDHASGSNRVDKYERDARLLTAALESETDEGLIARYTFYLANTWRDAGQNEKALPYYEKRAELGGWQQEVFMSLLNAGRIKSKLDYSVEDVLAAFEAAHQACPTRAEALHEAARFCNAKSLHEQAYRYTIRGLAVPYPDNGLFVSDWVYNYGLLDELTVCAYWTGRYSEGIEACDRLLTEGKFPASDIERIKKNREFSIARTEADWGHVPRDMHAYRQAIEAVRKFEKSTTSQDLVIEGYDIAAVLRPDFAEALHAAARFCRSAGLYKRGYEFAVRGLEIPKSPNVLPVDEWIYSYGLLDEFAVTAYWTGRYTHCIAACERLLSEGFLPAEARDRIAGNRAVAQDRLNEIEQAATHQNDPFLRLLYEARRIENLEHTPEEVMLAYRAAALYDPRRPEPWHDAARYCRFRGDNFAGVGWAQGGLNCGDPGNVPGREDWIYEFGLRYEYSICANYSEDPDVKQKGRVICDGLALDRSIPESLRKQARLNLRFYDKSLAECAPSTQLERVDFVPPTNYQVLNPSIAQSPDGFTMIQRTANYLINHGRYTIVGDGTIHTRNFLLEMDHDRQIISKGEIIVPPGQLPVLYNLVLGMEDARIFYWRGERWCITNVRQMNPEGWCEQMMGRIDPLPDGNFHVTQFRRLVPQLNRTHEKNWVPFVDGDELRFFHWYDPVRVMDKDANIISEVVPTFAADAFRGGSQAIAFDGGWLSLVHEVMISGNSRVYLHRFIWFDADLVLKRASETFWFVQRGIEFAAGLAPHSDGKTLVLSFGVNDRESWLATVSADEIRAMLATHSA